MASQRLSCLQKRILEHLWIEYQRTRGSTSSGHTELVKTLSYDKGNVSHSLVTLEKHGLITVGRTPGGLAENVILTKIGRELVVKLAGGCE